MQLPTHILAGVAIQKAFQRIKYRPVALLLTAVLAFLSHGLLDKLAILTYHRPDADFNDPVWVGYHVLVLLASIFFFYKFWRKYKFGIMFAILPDFDWVFIHGQKILGIDIPFYKTAHIHSIVHYVYDNTWPFYYLNNLPDYRYNPWTALFEIVAVILFYILLTREGVFNRETRR